MIAGPIGWVITPLANEASDSDRCGSADRLGTLVGASEIPTGSGSTDIDGANSRARRRSESFPLER